MDVTGGGRATSLASRLRFCAMAASVNLNCAPLGPRRRNRPSRRMRFRCANSISTLLAVATRSRERFGLGEGTGDMTRGLVHIADNPSRWHVRAALRLERARATLRHGGEIPQRVIGADMTGCGHRLARRACIDVALLVIDEVLTRERAIVALRLVDYRDMRGDPLLIN